MKKVLKNNLFLLRYVYRASKFRIPLAVLNTIMDAVMPVINILLVKYSIDMVVSGDGLKNFLILIAAIAILYTIFFLYGAWYRKVYCLHSDLKIQQYIQKVLYEKEKEIDLKAYDNPDFYNQYTKAMNEAESQISNVLNTWLNLIRSCISCIGVVVIVLTLEPLMILFTILPIIISICVSNMANKIQYSYDMECVEQNRKKDYVKRIFYQQQYIKDLKLFDMSDYFIRFYHTVIQRRHDIADAYSKKLGIYDFIQAFVQIAFVLSMICYLGCATYNGWISVGDFAGLLNSSQELGSGIQSLFSAIPQFIKNSMYIENIQVFLDYQSDLEQSKDKEVINEAMEYIEIKNLGFQYSISERYVLKNINMKINRGDKIAIVGYNGSGKSTLVKCLLRLYDASSGEIIINGRRYRDLNAAALRDKFGVVFQDFQCFAISLADNILCRECVNDSDKENVLHALGESGLLDKVRTLDLGIATILSKEFDDKGTILSGGELQKLAIARAISKKSEILIFDEPSSALDPMAEYELNKKIMDFASDKTLILISHRLSTTKDADKIYFLDNGEIVESGTHQELMLLNGKYAELFQIQAEKYTHSEGN